MANMLTFAEIMDHIMTPSPSLVFFGLLFVFGAPILLHFILSSSKTYTVQPTVLIMGPSNAGKTALLTLFERGTTESKTHTSQVCHDVELNASTDAGSKHSFKNHDATEGTYTKFLLVDTPGHGKLRTTAFAKLLRTDKLKGLVFMVDAAALGEPEALAPTAAYLYDVLLYLQKKASDKTKAKLSVPVLIAANKVDLFTALPATLVKLNLEAELTRIRASKSKGLLDSGVGMDDIGSEEHDAWLGEYGSEKFTFSQLQEFEVDVDVIPGNISGDGPGAERWWSWIAQRV